jgi:hypothetical protein
MLRKPLSAVLGLLVLTLSQAVPAAVGRAFVASYGADTNTALNCGPTAPCRSFNAALSVTVAGGEVVVLDSAGYGPAPVNITQSVTITVPAGVYAGITVPAGATSAISISGAQTTRVVLNGLTINSTGATDGIVTGADLPGGATLEIAGCLLKGFGFAISIGGGLSTRISDTTILDTAYTAIYLEGGASAALERVKIYAAGVGVYVYASTAGTTAVTVADTVISNGSRTGAGLLAQSDLVGAVARISVVRSQISDNEEGVRAYDSASGGQARISLSQSVLSGNEYGIYATGSGASVSLSASSIADSAGCGAYGADGAVGYTYGNNALSNNAQDTCGDVSLLSAALK